MTNKRPTAWRRLDNAAKIFPSTSQGSDTRVFRFSCTLKEMVDGTLLQQALDETIGRFPSFSVVMRKGFFWYYLEQRDFPLLVEQENAAPCARLYENGRKEPLLRVSYYRERINLEIYHALTDGTGALQFLKTLVCYYLRYAHPDVLGEDHTIDELNIPLDTQANDSFQKYYLKNKDHSRVHIKPAFHQKGSPREDDSIQVLEGIVSVKDVLAAAHRYNTTMTVYVTAVLIDAFHRTMYLREEKKPVVISVPVNLRNYFPSETTGNFFGMVNISYDFSTQPADFASIIQTISQSFLDVLTKDRLMQLMNSFAALEHNAAVRVAPLPFKNFALRWSRSIADIGTTSVISNVGKILLPEVYEPYVDRFCILASTLRSQLCMCSFGDKLSLGFTSALTDVEAQRNFFRALADEGITTTLYCNDYEEVDHAALSEL